MAFDSNSTPAFVGDVVPFPLPAPPYDKNKRSWLKPGEPLPDNVRLIRTVEPYDPQPVPMTMERAALCAIFEVLKPKEQRAVLGSLWRSRCAGDDDDAKFYVARKMLLGEKV